MPKETIEKVLFRAHLVELPEETAGKPQEHTPVNTCMQMAVKS